MTSSAPNPKRVISGRANRAKRAPLSDLSRQRLRDAIFRNRPWEKSTGPSSKAGLDTVTKNLQKLTLQPKPPKSFYDYASDVLDKVRRFRRIEKVNGEPVAVFGATDEFHLVAEHFLKEMAAQRAAEEREYLERCFAEFGDNDVGKSRLRDSSAKNGGPDQTS